MRSKSTVVILSTVLGILFWEFLRDSALAVAIESTMESLAAHFGVSKPEMIAAVSPFVFSLLAAWAVTWTAYGIGRRDRAQKSPLVIEYRWNDPQYVQRRGGVPGDRELVSRYWISILNRSWDRTISDIEVVWDKNVFTEFIDYEMRREKLGEGPSLHPRSRDFTYLFGIADELIETQGEQAKDRIQRFTIRARGKDAGEVVAEFEYCPLQYPKVLRVT
jgi:hypothetical protein